MIFKKALFGTLSFFVFESCQKNSTDGATIGEETYVCNSSPVPKGSRKFGMDILNPFSGGNYGTDFAALKNLGGSYQTLHLAWSSLEAAGSGTTSGTFTDPGNALQTFSSLASSDGIKLSLTIRPIDATGKTVPSDLASTRFNTAVVKTRFKALVDYVMTRIPKTNLVSIMIGNEIDNYNPGADTNFWTDYGDFLNDVRTYANTNHAGLPIGFTATFEGVTNSSKTLSLGFNSVAVMQTYANLVDAVGVTYYPVTAAFAVHSASVVTGDFIKIVNFTSKPIHIQEIGFPSGSMNASSNYFQAEFFCEALKAWDTQITRIPNMALLRMNDVSRSDAEALAGPYGLSSEAFIEYLRTLGLQTNSGVQKQAFRILDAELKKRSF